MEKIQTLIFDLGGVIINLKKEKDWLQEDLLPNFQAEKLQQLQQNNFFTDFETGKIEVHEFIQQLKNIALDKFISDEKIIRHWNAILLDIPKHRVDLLKKLSQRYQLILLSNTNHIHLDYIRDYMQQEFGEDVLKSIFHTCYYSQEVGHRKPDKEIYEFVLQQQGIRPSESLFMDDKPENLIEPQKAGWQTTAVDFNNLTATALAHLL